MLHLTYDKIHIHAQEKEILFVGTGRVCKVE